MKNRISALGLTLLSCLYFAVPTQAQNQLSLGELQSGQLALNLSLTEQRQVEQDTLNVSLQFETQGRDRADLQDEVNKVMAKALDIVKAESGLKFNTTHYQVYIVYTDRPNRADINNPVYRAQQGLNITSTDSATLLDLSGKLQEAGLTLTGLYYSLSDEVHEEVAAELLYAALTKLQNRAEGAAEALGKSAASLVEVSMDGTPNFKDAGVRMSREMFAVSAADFAAPVADPGETMISITVSARAVLSP